MNVLTTPRRLGYFLDLFERVELEVAASEWLMDTESAPNGRKVATMPADGWHLLAELLRDDVFGPRGFVRPKTPNYKLAATREVQEAVNTRRLHPGLKGAGVIGPATEVITGWRPSTWGPISRWAAFRREIEEGELHVLVPWQVTTQFTAWASADPRALPSRYARLGEEHEHLRFCIEVQANR